MPGCPTLGPNVGLVRGLTASVDCHVQVLAHDGYASLFGRGLLSSPLFTAVLTIAVASIGYRLLLARSTVRLGDAPLIALKFGLVLALSNSWAAYQTVVFDLAFQGPEEIASRLRGVLLGPHSIYTRNVVDGLQFTYDQLVRSAMALSREASHAAGQATGQAAPQAAPMGAGMGSGTAGVVAPVEAQVQAQAQKLMEGGPALGAWGLWISAGVLMVTTLGVLLISKVALGLLLALGPAFLFAALFSQTRGLAVGWARVTFGFAFAPLAITVFLTFLFALIEGPLIAIAKNIEADDFQLQPIAALTLLVLIFGAGFLVSLKLGADLAAGFTLPTIRRQPAETAAPSAAAALQAASARRNLTAPSRAEGVAQAVSTLQSSRERGSAGDRRMVVASSSSSAQAPAASAGGPILAGAALRSATPYRRLGEASGSHRFQRK